MNVNGLYPVVHDLTDAESSMACWDESFICAPPGCFSLHDLVTPEISPIPESPSSSDVVAPPARSTIKFQRQSTDCPRSPYPHLKSLIDDDRNDSMGSIIDETKLLFAEKYVLTRQLNRGNISNIWECVDRMTGARYAVKLVDRRHIGKRNEDFVYAEASILSQVKDGAVFGITKLVEFYDEPTHFYLVLDYCDGGDFLTSLVKRSKIPEKEAKRLAKSLLRGLVYLHKNNICHRNVKPENLLLQNKQDLSTVVIADFGMATRISTDADGDELKLTERCGTASYMAPEVINHIAYDTQADMWSFGVVMYYALVGQLPFTDESRYELYHKIVKSDYSFYTDEWLGISKNAKRFIANILHADPEVRMTAKEALNHPWLARPKPPPVVPPPTAPTSLETGAATPPPSRSLPVDARTTTTKSAKPPGRKLKGFLKPFSRKRLLPEIDEPPMDETKSDTTVSMISSATTIEVSHRRTPTS